MNYVESFELYLRTDKNASKSTVSGYMTDIKNFMACEGTPGDLTQVTSAHVRAFVAHLLNIGRKRGSVNRAVCSLKSFFNYLATVEKVIDTPPTETIKTTKKEKTLPKHISESDVESILKAATEAPLKDRLIVELLYGSGGRVSEVVGLKVEGVDFEEVFLSLFGKGEKERSNPIHEDCLELVREYMAATGISSGYLFPHKDDPARHMTREAAGKIVKRLAVKAGLDPKKISPHVFRHSFATHMLERGCDMAQLQELLGHEDIATTRIYARITKTSKRASYVKCHPLASKVL